MSRPIVYIDRSEVREGRFEELQDAVAELADFVARNVPQVITYNAYFDPNRTHMTIIHVHHDPTSLLTLMDRAGPLFPKFAPLIDLLTIEVYGEPGEAVMERLRKKAKSLGDATLQVHGWHAGFVHVPEAHVGEEAVNR